MRYNRAAAAATVVTLVVTAPNHAIASSGSTPARHGAAVPDLVISATSTEATVTNVGDAGAGPFFVVIPGGHRCPGSSPLPGFPANFGPSYNGTTQLLAYGSLAPGKAVRISFTTFSDRSRTITVDPGNTVRERSELNNRAVAPGIRCTPTLG